MQIYYNVQNHETTIWSKNIWSKIIWSKILFYLTLFNQKYSKNIVLFFVFFYLK